MEEKEFSKLSFLLTLAPIRTTFLSDKDRNVTEYTSGSILRRMSKKTHTGNISEMLPNLTEVMTFNRLVTLYLSLSHSF